MGVLGSAGKRGPRAFVELRHIIMQDFEIGFDDGDFFAEDRVVLARHVEEVFGKFRKADIARLNLRADARQLTDLLRAEIGLDVVFEGLDERRNIFDDGWADKLITQCAQHSVLILRADKAALDADARQREGAVAHEMKLPGRKNETTAQVVRRSSVYRLWQIHVNSADRVDHVDECAHVDRRVMINLGAEVERESSRK